MADPKFSRRAFSGLAFALAPVSAAAEYVHMLRSLLPPGRIWTPGPDGVLGRLLFASADEIWRVDVRAEGLLDEAHPPTTVELLPEYERELALAPAATIAERQANVVAHLIRRQRYRPIDFQTALASLLGQAVGDVVVIERSHAFAVSIGDDREIFRFFIYRNPASPGTYFLASAQELVEKMKPSHTLGHVIESIHFLCDNLFSLCDRDLLGSAPAIFVSASTAVTARSTTITLATPAGVLPGDTLLMLAFAGSITQSDLTTSAPPSGWSLMSRIDVINGRMAAMMRRIVIIGEPSSHVFTMTSTGTGAPLLGVIVAYRGLDNSAPLVAAAVEVAASTSYPCPSLTLTSASDMYLGWCGTNNSNASATPPAGTIERVDQGAAQDGFNRAVVFELQAGATGATGTQTATMSLAVTGVAAAYILRVQQGP